MNATFTFMGTGGSMGVPVLGCSCSVCSSSAAENKRLRSSGVIRVGKKTILIDCGPDFRTQAFTYRIQDLDMVCLTHHHYDHTAGLDELRPLYMHHGKPVPSFASRQTVEDIMRRFPYMFKDPQHHDILVPRLQFVMLEEVQGVFSYEGVELSYYRYEQPGAVVLGYKIGNFAYLTDIKTYSETIFSFLEGVEILVVSALRYTPSYLHFSVDEAVDFSRRAGVKQTYLTHMAHELEYHKLCSYLPETVRPGYDGLTVPFNPYHTFIK
jgi:phosphoribosyl 1,2-cyclic phosphate phosphodiesterase